MSTATEALPTFTPATYNISLNLSAIGSLFSFPTRFLAKMRKTDGMLMEDSAVDIPAWTATTEQAAQSTPMPGPAVHATTFPGPWAFFTSSYMVGLFVMAILMHRIQNIVVPIRPQTVHHFGPRRQRTRPFFRTLYALILPLDVSKTSTRLALHIPSLYFMCKMLLTWSLLLLQVSGHYPQHDSGVLHDLSKWIDEREMSQISWSTFCAVCAAFCVEGFVKGLDGVGVGIGAHMQANTSPFNLVGYAFLLHIYASPLTHVHKPEGMPSRPDKHVIFTIAIPLLQLTIFHILSIRKQWSTHRLIPTALSSILSLSHFHLTLLAHSSRFRSSEAYSTPSGTATYPLLNYIPNIFETVLILTTLLTIFLNCITQLLLSGSVTRPLLGLGTGSPWGLNWDEDFGVLLLRIGTASLEATGLRGWGNEVGSIVAAPIAPVRELEYGRLEMSRSGVAKVMPGAVTTVVSSGRRKRRVMKGWRNEIRDIGVNPADNGNGSGTVGVPGVLGFSRAWVRQVFIFVKGLGDVFIGLCGVVWDLVRGKKVRGARRVDVLGPSAAVAPPIPQERDDDGDGILYERFLNGEDVSDDDDDWEEYSEEASRPTSDNEEEETDGSEDGDRETLGLFSDLRSMDSTAGASSSTLLAHMTHSGGTPLTRRRYSSLLDGRASEGEEPASTVAFRLAPTPSSPEDESRRNCVICTSEARQIICWPCRCLSMCDECRENMAARSSASKHRCPCCRRPVEGYSRIFIP